MGDFAENSDLEIWLVVCSFIYTKYIVGGVDDVYVHNKYTLKLLSANSAVIVLAHLFSSLHNFVITFSED